MSAACPYPDRMPSAHSLDPAVTVVLVDSPESIDLSARADELDRQEQANWRALRRPADRRRYLVAHIGLRDALAQRLGLDPRDVRLGNDPCPVCCSSDHGRPISMDDPASTHWSISHTDGLVAIAVGSSALGIDVESIAGAGDTEFLDHVGTHPDDAASIASVASLHGDQVLGRTRLARWARLEAVLKATGAGLGIDPSTVAVGVSGPRTLTPPAPRPDCDRPSPLTVTDLDVGQGHVGALAVAGTAPLVASSTWT